MFYWTWSRCSCLRTGSDLGARRGIKLSIGVTPSPSHSTVLDICYFRGLVCGVGILFYRFWRVYKWWKLASWKKMVICSACQFSWCKCSHLGRTLQSREVCMDAFSVSQLCPTLCNPMDCSPPGSSVHGIFPGKWENGWVAISFSSVHACIVAVQYTLIFHFFIS